jgi:hypothetical protein
MYYYSDVKRIYESARKKPKTLKHETTLRQHGDDYAIYYWNTPVVTFHPDNTKTLRTNGWYTRTTMSRIHEYTGLRLYSDEGGLAFWGSFDHKSDLCRLPFVEGMKIDGYKRVLLEPLTRTLGVKYPTWAVDYAA